jgi:hypothetical protein
VPYKKMVEESHQHTTTMWTIACTPTSIGFSCKPSELASSYCTGTWFWVSPMLRKESATVCHGRRFITNSPTGPSAFPAGNDAFRERDG